MSAEVFAALIGTSFATSTLTAAFGIGGGAAMLAVLASLLPPAALIPVHGVVQLGSNAGRAVLLRPHIRWSLAPAFLVGSLIGIALGGAVALRLPPEAVQLGVGGFILWSVFAKPPAGLARWSTLAGAVSSTLTMFFGATGPFVAAYVKALNLDRHGHVATHAALMTAQHLLKSLFFGIFGFAFAPWSALVVGMILAGLAGTWAGRHVLNRFSDPGFRKVLNLMLILLALRLIWVGLRPLLGA
ncbi:MAG: sulfite exporter TauE/SafE family protein [Rhodobacteraceae bacterium]|nr:sulfite exporter TauE/SafE family protein [Paracoccaceae bacterium]